MENWPQWIIGFLLFMQCMKQIAIYAKADTKSTAEKIAGGLGGISFWLVFALILGFGGFWK